MNKEAENSLPLFSLALARIVPGVDSDSRPSESPRLGESPYVPISEKRQKTVCCKRCARTGLPNESGMLLKQLCRPPIPNQDVGHACSNHELRAGQHYAQ